MIDRGEFLRHVALRAIAFSRIGDLYGRVLGPADAILMFHRICDEPDSPLGFNRHLAITPDFFDRLLGALKKDGIALVSMDAFIERLEAARKGRAQRGRVVALTADDGYRDNLTEALPILRYHDAPMTIYIANGLIDRHAGLWWLAAERWLAASETIILPEGGANAKGASRKEILPAATPSQKRVAGKRLFAALMYDMADAEREEWLNRAMTESGFDRAALEPDLLMDWRELEAAASDPLITIGAHTVLHSNLSRLDEEAALAALTRSRQVLQDRLGVKADHFAYPYGKPGTCGPREFELAHQAGFRSAVTTRHGIILPEHSDHCWCLPRISVNGRYSCLRHVRSMLSGVTTPIANRGRRFVTV